MRDRKLAPLVFVLSLLRRTVRLGFPKCIAHNKKTTIIIICTDQTGPDGVGQHRAGPGSAKQVRTVSGSAGQGRTGSNRTGGNNGRSVPNKAGQDMTSRTGQGREGQCSSAGAMGMQDNVRVDPGWVGHGRIGRVARDRARSCKVGQDQAVSGRAGQDSARQVVSGQCQPGQGRAGQDREVSDRTGRGHEGSVSAEQGWALGKIWHALAWSAKPDRGGKGSVRECRARQDRVETRGPHGADFQPYSNPPRKVGSKSIPPQIKNNNGTSISIHIKVSTVFTCIVLKY